MNKRFLMVALVSVACTMVARSADDNKEQATVLVKQAADYISANGKEKALAVFSEPTGEFVKGELYIFVVSYEGVNMAHGGNPKMVGKNHLEIKDPDGTYFIKEMIKTAKSGGGWVDYKWTNPETKKIQTKATYVMPAPGMEAFVACGFYK